MQGACFNTPFGFTSECDGGTTPKELRKASAQCPISFISSTYQDKLICDLLCSVVHANLRYGLRDLVVDMEVKLGQRMDESVQYAIGS
jgi:hypothetical protein